MEKMYIMKKIIIITLIIIVLGAVGFGIWGKSNPKEVLNENLIEETEIRSICYYRSNTTASGLEDKASLQLNIDKGNTTGQFSYLPAEKDSKTGTFKGVVSGDSGRFGAKAEVIWLANGEGIENKEELIIDFDDEKATVGFGEMVQREDGTYVYKDRSNLYFIDPMDPIDCDMLNEKMFVENYLRENIKEIATNQPVLGGQWYLVKATINPISNTAVIIYEDGHILSEANLIYNYTKDPQAVSITKFEVKE